MDFINLLQTIILLTQIQSSIPFPTFKDLIPNGRHVLNPCSPSLTWNGVGHRSMYGAGPLNPFGEDFLRHGKNWTFELCQSDSDNDGRRNGEELGDPWCEWTPGSGGNLSPPRSHPGICDSSVGQCANGEVTDFSCPRQQDLASSHQDPFSNLVFQPPPLPHHEQNLDELDAIPNFQFLGRSLRNNRVQEPQPDTNVIMSAPTPPPPTPPPPIPSVIHKRVRTPPVITFPPDQPNMDTAENRIPNSLFSPFSLPNISPNEPKSHDTPPAPKPPDVASPPMPPPRQTPRQVSPFSSMSNAPINPPEQPQGETESHPFIPLIPQSLIQSPLSLPNNVPSATPSPPVPNTPSPNININPLVFPPMIALPNVNIQPPNSLASRIQPSPQINITATNDQGRPRNTFRPSVISSRNTPSQNIMNMQNTAPNNNNNNLPFSLQRRFPSQNQNNFQSQLRNRNPFSRQSSGTRNQNSFFVRPGQRTNRPNALISGRQNQRIPFSRRPFSRRNQSFPRTFPNGFAQVLFPMIPRNQSAVMGFPQRQNRPQRFPLRTQNARTQSATNLQRVPNPNQRLPVSNTANQRPRFHVQQVRAGPRREPERDDPSLFVVRTLRRVMRPNFTCPGLAGPNTYTWMLRLPRVQIPTRFQSGVCMVFNLPANGDFHLIGGTPVIDNRDAVQQMFVYGCDEDATVPVTSRPYACDGMPRRECQNIIGGYAGSIPGICFPRSGGIRIGRTGFKQIILQVRWTNLFGRFGTTDSSGMAMYYTNTLRQYDIGTKVLRATHFTIPPGQPAYTVSSTCPGECTVMQIRSPIYISMAFNHMHLLGRREKVELVRNGEVVSLITDEDAFSYDDPKAYWHQSPIQILPGDSLRMSCVYNSMNMRSNVSWGFGEADEICLATLFYYPKESWETTSCTSFRSIPLCKLETTGIVNGCDFNSFFSTLRRDFQTAAVLANCTMLRICNNECHSLATAAASHPCLKGDNFKLLESSTNISPDERLSVLFDTLKLCHSGIHENNAGIRISNNRRPVNLLPEVQTVKNMIRNNIITTPTMPIMSPLSTSSPEVTVPPIPTIPPLPTTIPSPPSTTTRVPRSKAKIDDNQSVVPTAGETKIRIIPINRNSHGESVQSTIIRLVQDHFRSVPISIVVISPEGLLRVENEVGLSSFTKP